MSTTRRQLIAAAASATMLASQTDSPGVTRFVRFRKNNTSSNGILEGETVQALSRDLFGKYKETGKRFKLAEVKLLFPVVPPQVLAVGLNYRSHLGERKPPAQPEIFFKPISCLTNPGDPIVIPSGSQNTHYEGELVIVMGKPASKLSEAQARDAIFGVTCGNDVSERDWQNGPQKDLQWWRAKGADTFGPCGPCIVRGVDYGKLQLRTKLNGEVVQNQSTSDLLFDCPAVVSLSAATLRSRRGI